MRKRHASFKRLFVDLSAMGFKRVLAARKSARGFHSKGFGG